MDCPLFLKASNVASMRRHPKLIKYYTDVHDVDEDTMTISVYNGTWISESGAGVAQRYVNNIHTEFDIFVASLKNKD